MAERFEAPQVPVVQLVQSVPKDPPALLVPTVRVHIPKAPTTQFIWLEWFAAHALHAQGPRAKEEVEMLSNVRGDAFQNFEFPDFVSPYISVRNPMAELERAQTMSEHGSHQGKRVQLFLGERDWEIQSARTQVRIWRT